MSKLYAISALFDSPDAIIKAAKETSNAGYEKYDVNTPYPVHGMDGAMKLPASKMGYFALAFGLAGVVIALLMMSYTMDVAYPLNIGGKPNLSWPAFVPITFELTVLLATVGTVIAMLFVFFKVPNNSHPIHDSNYAKRTSSDLYGVYIETTDAKFDEAAIKAHFESLGAVEIEEIYEEESPKPAVWSLKFIGFLVTVFVLVGVTDYILVNKVAFMVPFNWMMDQDRLDAQETTDFFEDGFSMRPEVEGTVARGYIPYMYKDSADKAALAMVNPLAPTEDIQELGKKKYLTYCSPCHDNMGTGDSRLKDNFPKPPSLHSKKVRDWADGAIYHVITNGQGVMPSYSKQMTREERWAVIHHLRSLQRAMNPKEEDF